MMPMAYEMDRWRAYAKALGFAKAEDAEKDYLQELFLYWISSSGGKANFIFRGGTAISKLYGSGRFSEDLDFIFGRETDRLSVKRAVSKAIEGIGLQYKIDYRAEEYRNMLKYVLKIKGPFWMLSNNPQAVQTIRLDINTYERPVLGVLQSARMPIYEDMRPYILVHEAKEELLADKIKAMLERVEPVARDLYDAWILSKKYSIKPDMDLVDKKMGLYGKIEGEKFSKEALIKRVKEIGRIWGKEIPRLMKNAPEYQLVSKEFTAALL